MASVDGKFPSFLPKLIKCSDQVSYELLDVLAEYRICHDGSPTESRIVCRGRQNGKSRDYDDAESVIVKIKVQVPGKESEGPEDGPSTTTLAELDALRIFTQTKTVNVPHLLFWKSETQGNDGPLPNGYITYIVMTELSGETLYNLEFWKFTDKEQEDIVARFLPVLQSIYALGIKPLDRGLRNIIWDSHTNTANIIDFELWQATAGTNLDESIELYKWGLRKSPPITSWMTAWKLSHD